MSEPSPAPAGVIDADIPCVGCGHNLRTLRWGALCPECARPVRDSLRPDDLRFADLNWLRRVRAGVTWLLVTGAVWLAFGGVLPFVIVLGSAQRTGELLVSVASFVVPLLYFSVLAAAFLVLCEDPQSATPGDATRIAGQTLVGVCGTVYAIQLVVGDSEPLALPALPYILHLSHGIVAGAAFSLTVFYLQRLASRARFLRLIYWTSIFLFSVVLLAGEHVAAAGIMAYKLTVADTDYVAADRVQFAIAPTSIACTLLGIGVMLGYRKTLGRYTALPGQSIGCDRK